MSNEPALSFEGVTRSFGRTVALRELNLEIEPGTVVGLLGRNGAGKTTCLRLAHGLLHPDAGKIRVLGFDPTRQGLQVRSAVSLLSEEAHLYPWMTVRQIVDHAATMHPNWDPELAQSVERRLELDPSAVIETLSRGTRAKVALLLAVSTRPQILLLDDPTAGLDPLVRREVLQGILETLPAEGGAVVYASHLIHDVERVADRVVFLDDGRVTVDEPLEALKRDVRRITAIFDDGVPAGTTLPGALDWNADGRLLSLVANGGVDELVASVRALGAKNVRVEPLCLEDVLVACLKRGGAKEVERG